MYFPKQMHIEANLIFSLWGQQSSLDHYLNNFCRALSSNALYQTQGKNVPEKVYPLDAKIHKRIRTQRPFGSREIQKKFSILYGHGGRPGPVT